MVAPASQPLTRLTGRCRGCNKPVTSLVPTFDLAMSTAEYGEPILLCGPCAAPITPTVAAANGIKITDARRNG
jgi:hypothetical protein